ncbi:Ovipostatin 3 [Biomphalaria glabrata]|nr:Ovipostatin 3 [Biomphalaria glabrata]
MKFVIFSVLALPMIIAQTWDPTKVCIPDLFQNDVYDFTKNDYGRAAVDFSKNQSAIAYVKAGFRVVYDLTKQKAYVIGANDSCTVITMTASQNIMKCLPPNAVELNNGSLTIGRVGHGLLMNSYEIPVDQDTKIRLGYTASDPAIPILRQLIGTNSSVAGDVLFFTNPKTSVDADLFVVPTVCPPLGGA